MTLARRQLLIMLALGLSSAAAAAAAPAPRLVITDAIVTDPHSGVAIYGFDPVLYFVEGRAAAGRGDIEAIWSGVAWRFASLANREAFLRDPDVFAPAFGGYDAEAVSRLVAVEPDPTVFLVASGRLFLFRSPRARDRFVGEDLLSASDKAWPALRRNVSP